MEHVIASLSLVSLVSWAWAWRRVWQLERQLEQANRISELYDHAAKVAERGPDWLLSRER